MRRVLLVVAVVLLTGCGGNDKPVAAAGESATAEGLEAGVKELTRALLRGDTEASFARLSAACQEQHGLKGWGEQMEIGLGFIEAFSNGKPAELKVAAVKVRNVTKTKGEAAVALRDKNGERLDGVADDNYDPYVYEDGTWRQTSCEPLGDEDDS